MTTVQQLGVQDGVFSETNKHAHYLTVYLKKNEELNKVKEACANLSSTIDEVVKKFSYPDTKLFVVLGLGKQLTQEWFGKLPKGYLDYKHLSGPLGDFPPTGGDLFVHIKSNYTDVCYLFAKTFLDSIRSFVQSFSDVQGFSYLVGKNGLGRDLTGFEDGTGNPETLEEKIEAAIITSDDNKGGSFLITQKWIHNVPEFEKLSIPDQEGVMGRLKENSGKMKPRPDYSHVTLTDVKKMKIFRQSLPHGNLSENGLFFIAYASDCEKFDVQLQNMVKVSEGLMKFSKCITGNYFYVPSKSELQSLLPKSNL